MYELEIHQKISKPDYHKLKTTAKRGLIRNSGQEISRPEMGELKQELRLRIAGVKVALGEDRENAGNGKRKDSVRKETAVVSDTMRVSV